MGSRDQDAVAAARNWREGWRGIIYLVEQGHSPIDVSAPSKARYVLAASARMDELEAAHENAEVLAKLVRLYINRSGPRKTAPESAWDAMVNYANAIMGDE